MDSHNGHHCHSPNMKLTQIANYVNKPAFDAQLLYQNSSVYLSMFVSDWLRTKKLDLGEFNRFVFEEGGKFREDLTIQGEKAFIVCVSLEYPGLVLETALEVHRYFVRKYLEGFERVDAHFNLHLTPELRVAIENEYASGEYSYEKKIAGKRLHERSVQLFHHYDHKEYRLIMRVKSGKDQSHERTLFTGDPDPFIVKFDVNKVEISKDGLKVINAIGAQTLRFTFDEQ